MIGECHPIMITTHSSHIQHPTSIYNAKGQLSKETIPALGDKRYTYDIYGRQTSVSIPSPTGSGVVKEQGVNT